MIENLISNLFFETAGFNSIPASELQLNFAEAKTLLEITPLKKNLISQNYLKTKVLEISDDRKILGFKKIKGSIT